MNKTSEILNLKAEWLEHEVINLQMTRDQKNMHDALCQYFKRTLANITTKTLQDSLNAKANRQPELEKFKFGSDQRIYELVIGESISAVMRDSKTTNIVVKFVWQSADQQEIIQDFTQSSSGSIDGGIGFFIKGKKGLTLLPIEAKSTMINPYEAVSGNLCNQAIECINKKSADFSTPSQLSALLILPYSNNEQLSLDLKPVINAIQDTIADDSLAAICLLSVHESEIRITVCMIYGKDFRFTTQNIHEYIKACKYTFPKDE